MTTNTPMPEVVRDLLADAAAAVYDVRAELGRAVSNGGFNGARCADSCIKLSGVLDLMHAAGVPVPRIPTAKEMNR